MIPRVTWRFCLPLLASLILLPACSALAASTNSAWFARDWQSEDGLPENRVTGIAQTADGFLWVATPSGLVRFDGVRFDWVSLAEVTGDVPDLANRIIDSMVRSRTGRLWLGLGGKVADLDADSGRCLVLTNLPPGSGGSRGDASHHPFPSP